MIMPHILIEIDRIEIHIQTFFVLFFVFINKNYVWSLYRLSSS